jgi:hypothetical protein
MTNSQYGWTVENAQTLRLWGRGDRVAVEISFATSTACPPAGDEVGAETFHQELHRRMLQHPQLADFANDPRRPRAAEEKKAIDKALAELVTQTSTQLAAECDRRIAQAVEALARAAGPALDAIALALLARGYYQQGDDVLRRRVVASIAKTS